MNAISQTNLNNLGTFNLLFVNAFSFEELEFLSLGKEFTPLNYEMFKLPDRNTCRQQFK